MNIIIVKQIVGDQKLIFPLRTDSPGQTINLFFSGETNNGDFQLFLLTDKEETMECVDDGFIEGMNTPKSSDNNVLSNCESDSDDFIDYFDISEEKTNKRSRLSETSSSSEECRVRYTFSKLTKQLIVNAKNYFQTEKDAGICKDVNKVIQKTSKCLNISVRSIYRITAELKNEGKLQEPHNYRSGRKAIEFDDFLQGIVGHTIFNMYLNKEYRGA